MVIVPRFDAEEMLRNVERYRTTHLLAVPTMFVRLLKLPEEVRRKIRSVEPQIRHARRRAVSPCM